MNRYKEPYPVKRTIAELSHKELRAVWWDAFTRDEYGDIEPDTSRLRVALLKLLESRNE